MRVRLPIGLGFVVVSCLIAVAGGCGDDDEAPAAGAGAPSHGGAGAGEAGAASADVGVMECRVLGELCHEAEAAGGHSGAHECHELGHESDGSACVAGFADCVTTCVDGSAEKASNCAALGELCHAVDDQDGPLHECHELGHVNDADICAAEFDHCARICLAARELLEPDQDNNAGAGGLASGGAGSR